MLALLRPNEIDLRTGWSQRPKIVAPDPKKENFSHIAEIETDSSSVRATILPDLFPDDISLVLKSPRFHNSQTIRQESIGNPKVQMAFCSSDLLDGQRHYVF